jgi:uncharacterized Tic20 family protein
MSLYQLPKKRERIILLNVSSYISLFFLWSEIGPFTLWTKMESKWNDIRKNEALMEW